MDQDPIWFRRLRSALGVAFLSTATLSAFGCAHAPAPTPAPQVACLPLRSYTKAQQQQAAQELAKLPSDSVVAQMVVDYGTLRDADRVCQSSK